jgi:hypothetical protein
MGAGTRLLEAATEKDGAAASPKKNVLLNNDQTP